MKPDSPEYDDLKRLAPGLSRLKNENPFSVPDHYFDSLSENIQKKIQTLPDFERTSPENPFRVPEGYFDSLPGTTRQRILEGKEKQSIFGEWISTVLRPKVSLPFATLIVLIISGIVYFKRPTVLTVPDNSLTCEEIKTSSCIEDIDETMLIEVLEQQQNSGNVKEDKSLEQYLIDNDIDISQLEKRL